MAIADVLTDPATTVASIFNRTGMHLTPSGRKDSDGQSAVPGPAILRESAKELMALEAAYIAASKAFGDRVKVIAEKSGFNAATVRKLIQARNRGSEEIADRLRKAEQLVMALTEAAE